MWHRPLRLRHLFTSASPAMSILLTLDIIRLNAPAMFRAMVAVPAAIQVQVRWERARGVHLSYRCVSAISYRFTRCAF
jgi:hypothetical protein